MILSFLRSKIFLNKELPSAKMIGVKFQKNAELSESQLQLQRLIKTSYLRFGDLGIQGFLRFQGLMVQGIGFFRVLNVMGFRVLGVVGLSFIPYNYWNPLSPFCVLQVPAYVLLMEEAGEVAENHTLTALQVGKLIRYILILKYVK